MATTAEQLRGLYTPEQLVAMDRVSSLLKANPAALDTRKHDNAGSEGKEEGSPT